MPFKVTAVSSLSFAIADTETWFFAASFKMIWSSLAHAPAARLKLLIHNPILKRFFHLIFLMFYWSWSKKRTSTPYFLVNKKAASCMLLFILNYFSIKWSRLIFPAPCSIRKNRPPTMAKFFIKLMLACAPSWKINAVITLNRSKPNAAKRAWKPNNSAKPPPNSTKMVKGNSAPSPHIP